MSNAAVDGVMPISIPIPIPGWEADASGYVLSMEAEVVTRRSQDVDPPQLIFYFCLQTNSPSTHDDERTYFTIDQLYENIIDEATWNVETRRMLSHVAAAHVPIADRAFLGVAFRRYTRAVLNRFPIMELSTMKFFSVIKIPPTAPSVYSAGHLRYLVPSETQRYFFEGHEEEEEEEEEDDDALQKYYIFATKFSDKINSSLNREKFSDENCNCC